LAAPHSDIAILDDPFSAVDGATGNWMFHKGVLEGLAGKTRIILLNSHLHLLSQFDRILILDDGKPIVLASPSEIMTNYKEIYLKIIGSIGRQHNGEEDKEDTMTDTPTPPTEVQSQSLLEETTSKKTGTNEKGFKKESSFSSSTVTNISPATAATASVAVAPVSTVTSETAPTSNGSAEGKLIIAENRAVGGIALRAYLSYFGAGFWDVSNLNHLSDKNQISWAGLGVVCAILFGFTITQFIRVCIDIELLNWASKGHWETDSPFMIGYLVLIVLLCLLVDIRTRIQTYFAGLTSLNIHHMMLRKVLNAPIPLYFDVVTVGNMLNKFGKDTETIDMNIPEFFYQTCLQFFILLSVVILCIWSLPLLIFYFIPLFGILIFQARKYSYVSRDLKRLEAISRTPIYSSFTETLIGIETIRAYGVVSRFYSRHLINMNRYQKFVFHSTMSQIWLTTRMEFGGCLILVGSSILAIIFKEFFEIQATKVGLALVYSLQVTAMLQRNVTLFIELQTYFTSVGKSPDHLTSLSFAHNHLNTSHNSCCLVERVMEYAGETMTLHLTSPLLLSSLAPLPDLCLPLTDHLHRYSSGNGSFTSSIRDSSGIQ
jgi:ATP-binding cassette, subfamily C (CFTR/MRP), member 1